MPLPPCLACQSDYVYQDQNQLICPECAYEWNPQQLLDERFVVHDVNGALLEQGDKITAIKDLKVKGSAMVVKIGTKAVIKRIIEGKDHQLDCKVDGGGEILITAKYVKKAH